MFGLNLLKHLPPAISTKLVLLVVPLSLALRFFAGTIFGALIFSAILYWYAWHFGDSKPLTFPQLFLWIDQLQIEAKTAVATSLLTITGFLVAFHTATSNWKAETVANLKIHVANEIELFFNEASRLIVEARLYVESLVEAVNLFNEQGPSPEVVFKIEYTQQQAQKFFSTRDRLSAMSIEVHRIASRHYSVLSTVPSAIQDLDICATAFSKIAQKMWVRVPNVQTNQPNLAAQFVYQVNVNECTGFVACCDRNYDKINGLSGGMRGLLLTAIINASFSSFLNLLRQRSKLPEVLSKIWHNRNG